MGKILSELGASVVRLAWIFYTSGAKMISLGNPGLR